MVTNFVFHALLLSSNSSAAVAKPPPFVARAGFYFLVTFPALLRIWELSNRQSEAEIRFCQEWIGPDLRLELTAV